MDYKAGIRYLRHNKDKIPGNTDRIITNGTSAGGALSALAGASGNANVFIPYLQEIGAANERDDVFASNVYCPIHNLEHADMAYKWMYHDAKTFRTKRFVQAENGTKAEDYTGALTTALEQESDELRACFPPM